MHSLIKNTLTVALAAVFCACSRTTHRSAVIEIEPTIVSRVTALNFEVGDEIGLRIERSSGLYADNALMTYGGNSFVAANLMWYDNDEELSTLKAYYPYQSAAFPTEFTIPADQRTSTLAADLLGAVRTNVTPSNSAVSMQFYHLMARLVINITNESSNTVAGVEIAGMIPTATLDWATPSATAKSGTATTTVSAYPRTVGSCYEAILVPQSATMSVAVTTNEGKRYEKAVTADLMSGKSYTLAVTLLKDDVSVALSGEIIDWGDGEELGGDDSGDDSGNEVPPTLESGTVTIGGESYTTRVIGNRVWMAENVRYLPDGMTVGTGIYYAGSDASTGAANVATLGYLYDYETVTTKNICPEGWHVPTGDELTALIGAACGEDFFTPAGFLRMTTDGSKYETTNNYLISSTIDDDGKCTVLTYTADGATESKALPASKLAFTLRCIKDQQ